MSATCTEVLYAIYRDIGSSREEDKPTRTVPQNLTPVMIIVVDTISSVRSRTLLKVFLYSGSKTKLINKKCLSRHCKPCKISSSRKVSTLAETYTSTEIVIMRNLSLHEFDKNRNVDQQKTFVFQSENCKYNVILGADFLTKVGKNAKYRTGTMEWFDN